MKLCKGCNTIKDFIYFNLSKRKKEKDGHQYFCKECNKKYSRKRYYEKRILYNIMCLFCHKSIQTPQKQKKFCSKKCYAANYFQNNKQKRYKNTAAYQMRRRHRDPTFRLRTTISSIISMNLKKNNGAKHGVQTFYKLNYTPFKLKIHLESQFDQNMNWENYGKYWEIDHIIPQSKLLYDSMDHPNFLKCWSFENLRPLEKIENRKKGNKINF